MARNPAPDSARTAFAKLLAEHLANGTRPATAAGEPWSYASFAREVQSSRDNSDFASARSVSNWCKGTSLPAEIEPILRALFGPSGRHGEARAALREAFRAARAEKQAAVIARTKPDPAGARWVAQGDQLAIDRRTVRPTDRRVAADPLQQQLQAAIRDVAADLAQRAKRLSNSTIWGDLPVASAAFYAEVDRDPLRMPERLGYAYPRLLRLGRFLETDLRLRRDPTQSDDLLDPDIHGLLTDLVQVAAPWLRGFPTVAAWDDAAGKALVRADLFEPARNFIEIALTRRTISEEDAAEFTLLSEAADERDYQGQKAGNRGVGGAKNLMLVAAGTVAAFISGATASDFATRSLLVQRAGATLAAAEAEVEAFAATLPDDLRQALRGLVSEGRRLREPAPAVMPSPPEPLIPDNVEDQARTMILQGRAPPAAWRPLIRKLAFIQTALDSLGPLTDLTALQRLDLESTEVTDLAPLARLTDLQILDLWGTPVSDVGPLAGLTALHRIDLTGTKVTDLAPLAGLTALYSVELEDTLVSDLTPLAGLTALYSLNLAGTGVMDLTSLAGLTALRLLALDGTRVSDLTPLAGLTNLHSLRLRYTSVTDVAPLAGLTALESLDLRGTRVTDVAPLAGLTALQRLDLRDTPVTNVFPLDDLANLDVVGFGLWRWREMGRAKPADIPVPVVPPRKK